MNRELSYTLMVSGDEIYARYKSWPDAASFASSITQLCPIKIDIGAIYPCPPEDRSTIGAQFQPLSKELVFDIDMTDYDKTRFCCTGANICHRCWVLMTAAIQITDKRLKSDFGFQHVLWIYSGRRGVHCWVSDERARQLTTNGRAAVVDYLSVIGEKAKDDGDARVVQLPKRLHPMLADVCDIAREPFEAYIEAQELLEHVERFTPLLALIPSSETRDELLKSWTEPSNYTDTRLRWQQLKATVERDMSKNSATKASFARAPHVIKEIMLAYVYPRYDAAVTRGFNHLLKSPFVVHPKTGRVCVPINAAMAAQFDPLAVPTVLQLIAQIDEYDKQHPATAATTPHWKKTALAPYQELFEFFLGELQKSTCAERLRDAQAKQDPLSF
jgi:DNA primase small subunit